MVSVEHRLVTVGKFGTAESDTSPLKLLPKERSFSLFDGIAENIVVTIVHSHNIQINCSKNMTRVFWYFWMLRSCFKITYTECNVQRVHFAVPFVSHHLYLVSLCVFIFLLPTNNRFASGIRVWTSTACFTWVRLSSNYTTLRTRMLLFVLFFRVLCDYIYDNWNGATHFATAWEQTADDKRGRKAATITAAAAQRGKTHDGAKERCSR